MGASNFSKIHKKYNQEGIDYVVARYKERLIYERINDKINSLKNQANKNQKSDLQFINGQRANLQNKFEQSKKQATTKNAKSIEEAEARTKLTVQKFSGYNDELKEIQKVEKDVKEKYQKEKARMQENVKDQVRSPQTSCSKLPQLPEYDERPDNYKRQIEKECLFKYPQKSADLNTSELQKKLTWDNFKQNFESILDREKLQKDIEAASKRVSENVIPGGTAVCC